ncbi:hypothetical protein CQA53_08795 [Helicobacter didelphidarum]|uniref:Outer membrane beta-barrel protein n=2 Tax=Helicobacter didelphidarum TaxID=2040648 RepID=A0A3D8IDW8_9HELI|nr:hypothetical protein CQA53_08795 [Helicobacter didelphidarum]
MLFNTRKKKVRRNHLFFIFVLLLICIQSIMANDFTEFSQDDGNGLLQTQNTSQSQVSVDIVKNTALMKSKTPQQISLLRETNTQRNGIYVMVVGNVIPLQRLNKANEIINGVTLGMGLRSGVVSYLDDYIGMRGYFGIDVTSDQLSPFKKQRLSHSGNFIMLSLGLDILIDFFIDKSYKNMLGFFIGIGAGGLIYFDAQNPILVPSGGSKNTILTGNIMVQGGISATFFYRHRLEVGARFLPTQSFDLQSDGILADYNFYVGYSYKFKGKK